jgi:hypothetical protein
MVLFPLSAELEVVDKVVQHYSGCYRGSSAIAIVSAGFSGSATQV